MGDGGQGDRLAELVELVGLECVAFLCASDAARRQ